MSIVKKVLKGLLYAILFLFALMNLLLSVGTFYEGVPFFGTCANMITVGMSQIWLPMVFVLTSICFLLADRWQTHFLRVLGVMSSISFLCGAFIISSSIQAVNARGGDAHFWNSYGKVSSKDIRKETVRYEDEISDNSFLDVYTVDDGKEGKPVVLSIHGGGWSSGSRENSAPYMKQFAQSGYVAVTAEYDLSSKDEHEVGTVEKQLSHAMIWIGEHIEEYGGDVKSLYLTGDSAGGNLALDLAYKIDSGIFGGNIPKVQAVSVLYPVTDMAGCYFNDHPLWKKTAKEMVFSYMGSSPEANPRLYASVSPIHHVTEDAPPTCILVGEKDTVVSPTQSYALAKKLAEYGVDEKLVRIPYANHLVDMGGTNFAAQAYMRISLDWFASHQ
jgi:acetyl esterase/lipase